LPKPFDFDVLVAYVWANRVVPIAVCACLQSEFAVEAADGVPLANAATGTTRATRTNNMIFLIREPHSSAWRAWTLTYTLPAKISSVQGAVKSNVKRSNAARTPTSRALASSYAMRIPFLLVAAALFSTGVSSGATPATSLSIAVYPDGLAQPASAERYTLRCGPAAGTVPQPMVACRTLAGLVHPFAPTPRGTFCTDIAIGPQQATVKGRVRGTPVNATLRAQGGCEINRWRRVRTVVPGFPGR
jgi:hypothetical protein